MNIRELDLNLLVIFDALFQDKNVSKAAKRVGLSQSAMSNALARLRESLKDPLFTRTARGIVPTQRAAELEQPVREALHLLEQSLGESKAFDPAASDSVFELGTTDYIEFVFLPKLLKRLQKSAPAVRVEVHPLTEKSPLKALEEGKVEIAIGHFQETKSSLYKRELFTDPFVCAVKEKGAPPKMTLSVFAEKKHVIVSPWGGLTGLVDQVLGKTNKKRTVIASTPHFLMAPALVAETDYLVTLPKSFADSIAKNFDLKVFPHPLDLTPLSISLLWHERSHADAKHKWFREEIVQLVNKPGANK